MTKSFTINKPAINMTVVGFGNAGSRIADVFATYKNKEGKQTYNSLALNSNAGDLEGLSFIPEDNRVNLDLGGLGKNPTRAIEILEENKDAKSLMKEFVHKKIRPQDDMVLFLAGLGGGTGTATIVKAIAEFAAFHNTPKITEEIQKVKNEVGSDDFKQNQKKHVARAIKRAEKRFVKIGVIVTLPLRNDGPDVLRQVNEFSQQLWKIANDPTKGVAFVTFADNQYFYDEFKALPENQKQEIKNYRDYANRQIATIFHELNTATTSGGTAVQLDSQDFRRAILEHRGSLVLSKLDVQQDEVKNKEAIVAMFKKAMSESTLHSPIELVQEDSTAKRIHHIGLLAVLEKQQRQLASGSFLEDSIEYLHESLPVNGTVFSGYIEEKNDFNTSVYVFYKVEGLPQRLSKGLVEEFEEYQERNKKFKYEKATISSIDEDEDLDFDFDLSEFSLDEGTTDETAEQATEDDHQLSEEELKNILENIGTD